MTFFICRLLSTIVYALSRPSTATSGKETKNTFTNDGSFFEQFKKMQQKPQNQEGSKIYDSKSDNDNIMNSKQSTLSLGYAANTNSSAHKRMLTSPPPPPPKPSDSKDNPSQGMHLNLLNHFINILSISLAFKSIVTD